MNVVINLKKNFVQRRFSTLSERVSYLLEKEGLHEAEFARKAGIKQQICNQILRGQTANPRLETLIKLASFFNVTVGQLIGVESLEQFAHEARGSVVPVLEWNDVIRWVEKEELHKKGEFTSWIGSDLPSGNRAYAIRSNPILEPYFDRNAVLLIDPSLEYCIGHFVVACLNSSNFTTITVRRLVGDLGDIFLNSILPGIPSIKVDTQVRLLGTVVETRQTQITSHFSIKKGKFNL